MWQEISFSNEAQAVHSGKVVPMQEESLGWSPSEALLGNPFPFTRRGSRRLPGSLAEISDSAMQELCHRRRASVRVLAKIEGSQGCSCQMSRFSQACPACSLSAATADQHKIINLFQTV